jgi:hypothetical protein
MEVLDASTRLGDEAGLMPFLFSYGTLQQEDVELSTFGMRLSGLAGPAGAPNVLDL